MRIPLKQRVVHKVGQLFQTSPFLIHSQQINNTCSSFCCWLNTYRHSWESSALLQCCVVKTSQLHFEGQHGEPWNLFIVWFQLTSLRSLLLNGLINIYSIFHDDKKHMQGKFNILTNLILLMQFWVDDLYRLNVNLF